MLNGAAVRYAYTKLSAGAPTTTSARPSPFTSPGPATEAPNCELTLPDKRTDDAVATPVALPKYKCAVAEAEAPTTTSP